MWKATAGMKIEEVAPAQDDDWETDPDFINDVSEEEQRWGSKTVEGSGRTAGAIDMNKLRYETEQADQNKKTKEREEINPGYGYGGKYGVQSDRVDKSAAGWDHIEKVEKHASQKDYATGFGGKYGVQSDRVDKSAAGWDHVEKVEKHASQKDYAAGFGGKFGVQKDRVDKSAVGWDHVEKVEKHESQKDYSKGFGGKYGIQEDRKDKSAVGWDHKEAVEKHESQVDHKVGFGGKFGVQKDRMDKSAAGYEAADKEQVGTSYTKVKPNIEGAKPSNLRAKFENLAKMSEEETRKRAEEQKRLREAKDRRDREEAAKKTIVENTPFQAAEEARTPPAKGVRSFISTGRQGGIGNAINAFNQMQSPTTTEAPLTRKEPINIPKENNVVKNIEQVETQTLVAAPQIVSKEIIATVPTVAEESAKIETPAVVKIPLAAPPPDVIPSIEIQHVETPPEIISPEVQSPVKKEEKINEIHEPLYQNQAEVAQEVHKEQIQPHQALEASAPSSGETATATLANNHGSDNGAQTEQEAIYANSENLADYLEDTGLLAIALYDYQAADDDEISFDPDDTVTHIEMIDEGWWRGLCKNRYGLFPANYVQLINHL